MDYASSTGTNYVSKGMRDLLSVRERVNTNTLLEILSKSKRWEWPDYETLRGKKMQPLGEVRLKGDQGVPIRLLGFFCAEKKQFVILIVCKHKGSYKPPNCFDTAADRYKALTRGIGQTKEHFNDDDEEIGED